MKKIISIIMIATMILMLTACGGVGPDKALSEFIDAVKSVDTKTIEKYVEYDVLLGDISIEKEDAEFVKSFFSNLEYEIISSEDHKETATVEVEITNINLGEVMKQFMGQLFAEAFSNAFSETAEELTEEEQEIKIKEQFKVLIETNKDNKVTNRVAVNLNKVDKQWKIEMTEELQNALMGNLYETTKEIEASF